MCWKLYADAFIRLISLLGLSWEFQLFMENEGQGDPPLDGSVPDMHSFTEWASDFGPFLWQRRSEWCPLNLDLCAIRWLERIWLNCAATTSACKKCTRRVPKKMYPQWKQGFGSFWRSLAGIQIPSRSWRSRISARMLEICMYVILLSPSICGFWSL